MKVLLFSLLAVMPAVLQAQALEPDQEGCKDSTLLTRMPGCRIYECDVREFDSADLLTGVKNDAAVTKTVEGRKEVLTYECESKIAPLQIVRNMQAAMTKAGYKFVYSGKDEYGYPAVTGQSGSQWIWIKTWENGSPLYTQTAVFVEQMEQKVAAEAGAWAEEIERTGRVSVYGVNFATGKAEINADSESVLNEIVTLLNSQPEWKLRIEGHTDKAGAKAANQVLSQKRAESVVAWLASHGIERSRLVSQGLGDTRPVGDNTTEEGRAKNRRVELVKL
jgi:outer membrane protein OmpA-like peptidoglycan-associated protein